MSGYVESEAAVVIDGVDKVFNAGSLDEVTALSGIDLTIGAGEFVSLIGPSGCGKSTLLRLIGDLLTPSTGKVTVFGKPAHGARLDQDYGMVFQHAGLFDWRRVAANIELPLELRGWSRADRAARSAEMLDLVKLPDFGGHYPRQLSGGMQQRVSIARALTTDPSMLLMDEPFGSLDLFTRDRMNLELLRIWGAASRRTAIFVTHSIREAIFLSDSVAVLSPNPGRLLGVHRVKFPRPRQLNMRDSKEFREMNFAIEESIEKAILQN